MVKHKYEQIGETLYEERLENGLGVFVFPKPDFGITDIFFPIFNCLHNSFSTDKIAGLLISLLLSI